MGKGKREKEGRFHLKTCTLHLSFDLALLFYTIKDTSGFHPIKEWQYLRSLCILHIKICTDQIQEVFKIKANTSPNSTGWPHDITA